MPEISRFFGISIKMFFGDHVPPHFHAEYGEFKAQVNIRSHVIIGGDLPRAFWGWLLSGHHSIKVNYLNYGNWHPRTCPCIVLSHLNNRAVSGK